MEIHIYRAANREWRWKAVASNGKKLANGGEGYKRRAGLAKALKILRRQFGNCKVIG